MGLPKGKGWLWALTALLMACGSSELTPATQIIVSITSDIEPASELSRIEVTLGTRDGKDVVAQRDFAIAAKDAKEGQYELPLTFSITKGKDPSFLLEVTGFGPLGAGGAETKIVEQKAVATFQSGATLLLKVFLGRICLENFCDGDAALVCYPADRAGIEAASCGAVPVYRSGELEKVSPGKLPDLAMPPAGTELDGGALDGGATPATDGGCVGADCPCTGAASCDDGLFCTVDACDAGSGQCGHTARVCGADANACTLAPVCNESTNACEEAFDATSLTSAQHCGSSATSACVLCMTDDTTTASCVDGTCRLTCAPGRVDADGKPGNGCECARAGDDDAGDDLAIDANCDGADGVLGGAATLYVTPTGAGSHDGAGPENAATLAEAIAVLGTRRELLLATGQHELGSQFVVPDGLVMLGGYAADFRTRAGRSEIVAHSASALRIASAVTGVTIDAVNIATDAQTTAGAHTHSIDIIASANVLLRRMTVSAGKGGAGTPGAAGGLGQAALQPGADGSNAASALAGGNGGTGGAGGDGGAGGSVSGTNLLGGASGGAGTRVATGCGHGGGGGPSKNDTGCLNNFAYAGDPGVAGEPGCDGGTGSQGAAGSGAGTLVNGEWQAAAGTLGGVGIIGGSGGGGGGGGAYNCNANVAAGGGGEGGPGGAGGLGGAPGAAGGASIAILAESSSITLTEVVLVTGGGGAGGIGGSGGLGGSGAAGGEGGAGAQLTATTVGNIGGSGGKGGRGGTGGPGGCGGGGAGGPSIGIFGQGSLTIAGTPAYTLGAGGSGGAACAAGGGNAGAVGSMLQTYGF